MQISIIKHLLAFAVTVSLLPQCHAAFTTIAASTAGQWQTGSAEYLVEGKGSMQCWDGDTTNNAANSALTMTVTLATSPQLKYELTCDGSTQTMTVSVLGGVTWSATAHGVPNNGGAILHVYTSAGGNAGWLASPYTPGAVCAADVQTTVNLNAAPGETARETLTRASTTETTTGTPSLTITPSLTGPAGGALSSGTDVIPWKVEGATFDGEVYTTNVPENNISVTVPVYAPSGTYTGSATVTMNCN